MSLERQAQSVRLAEAVNLVRQAVQNYQEAKAEHDHVFRVVSPNPFVDLGNRAVMNVPGGASLSVRFISFYLIT